MIRRPPRSTLFPTRRSSDLVLTGLQPPLQPGGGPRLSPEGRRPGQSVIALRIEQPERKIGAGGHVRSEEHTSELQSHVNLVCRLLLEKKKKNKNKKK